MPLYRYLIIGLLLNSWQLTAEVEYNRDIRPILSENCFPCHGADSAARKADLRLDHFEDAIARRGDDRPAIVPGKPEGSELVHRIFTTDEDDRMPPAKSHKVLTAQQKETLKRWILEGAKYEPHWSFITPKRAASPKVRDTSWVRNPIDNFILARIEQEKLRPAPEADRRTLARRLSLDLTGLPPDPQAVEAFVQDQAPDAYEKLVDRLLSLPQWGEHRAHYWLDGARYADTHGIHFDNYREMWIYRDWVIKAFNQNMPFDQFTVEQLAGDLLPQRSLDQEIATGFNRCNITTSEGGAIDEEYLVLYTRDRTETTSQVWLGLTAGCAVCHDHKYDPLSQKEFYALSAFFNNTTQKAMDGNVKDTPPVRVVTQPEDRSRWEKLLAQLEEGRERISERKKSAEGEFKAWLTTPQFESAKAESREAPSFHVPLSEGESSIAARNDSGREVKLKLSATNAWEDGAVAANAYTTGKASAPAFAEAGDFDSGKPFSYAAWIRPAEGKSGAVFGRMQDKDGKLRGWDLWLSEGLPIVHFAHDWPRDAIRVLARNTLLKGKWNHVCVTYDGSSVAEGVKIYLNGEQQPVFLDTEKDQLGGSIRTKAPFKIGQRDTSGALDQTGVQDVRLYGREVSAAEVKEVATEPRLKWLAQKPAETRSKEENEQLYSLWLEAMDFEYQNRLMALRKLEAEKGLILSRGTVAHVMNEATNRAEAHVLYRGEYDKRRDQVTPGTPAALPAMPEDLPRNRLGLAKWLLLPEQPLTARVAVNRFWQEIFGTGLVRTSGDFGVAGETPSHPELLDWLAIEFRESVWDVKRLFKLLVMSATYRQAPTTTPEKNAQDPQNRLLTRGPSFRMDAEMIRDYALAASGLLVNAIGGPSVKPYQPDGVWKAVSIPLSDTSKYQRDTGDKLYRRSLYTFWKRSAPPASMEIFNAPAREVCTVRRERTDTPLQALVTLNDEQFVEAARQLAQKTIKQGGSKSSERLDFMARRLLARPLRPEELAVANDNLKVLQKHYRSQPQAAEQLLNVGDSPVDPTFDKPTLAAYTMVANMLLNLDEVLNK